MSLAPLRFAVTMALTAFIGVGAACTAQTRLRPSHGFNSLVSVNPGFDDNAAGAPALTAVADLNNDGIPDMIEARPPQPGVPGHTEIIVLLGRKDGGFIENSVLPSPGNDPRAIVAGDFNRDGAPDIVLGDGNGALTEFIGDGKGNLVAAGDIAHFSTVVSIAAADFNHDGRLDLAISDSRTGTVSILLGGDAGSFRSGWFFRLPRPGAVYRLAAADFNNDGLPDLAVTNEDGDAYEVMLGNGNGTFTSSPELSHLKDPNAHCVT